MRGLALETTADPYVLIEEQSGGYVRYRRVTDGRRWEVYGTCDRRGDCLIGAVIEGERIKDNRHLEELKARLGVERLGSELDVPVTPEFDICCGDDIFSYVELKPAP